jgi:hypothetical protein
LHLRPILLRLGRRPDRWGTIGRLISLLDLVGWSIPRSGLLVLRRRGSTGWWCPAVTVPIPVGHRARPVLDRRRAGGRVVVVRPERIVTGQELGSLPFLMARVCAKSRWRNTAHPAGGGGCPPHCCGGGGLFAYGLYCCCWCWPCPGYWFHDMSARATMGVNREKPRRGDGGTRIAVEESRPVTTDVAPESVAIPLRMQIGHRCKGGRVYKRLVQLQTGAWAMHENVSDAVTTNTP